MKHTLSNETLRLLEMLLMPIAAMLIMTAFYYSSLDTYEAAITRGLLFDMTESVMLSLVIAVGGGLLFDVEYKHRGYSSSDKS